MLPSPNGKRILRKEFEFIVGGVDSKESEQRMMEIYQRFREYGAILPLGDGNIVHPKQYITIRGMDLIIDEFLVDKSRTSELKIAYIGTDTTENLRSLLRWLHKNGHMSKVVEFCLFYYDDWDYDFMEAIDLINEIKGNYSDFNIIRRDLSTSTINGLKNKENFDIIVSHTLRHGQRVLLARKTTPTFYKMSWVLRRSFSRLILKLNTIPYVLH